MDFFFALIEGLSDFMSLLIQNFGLLGIFFAAVLANATIVFGVPFEAFIVLLVGAGLFHPITIAVVGGLGAAIGELVGYGIGFGGKQAYEKMSGKQFALVEKFRSLIDRFGSAVVFLLLLIPIPFDFVGIAAGLVGLKPWKFFIATFAGKTVRYLIIAYAVLVGLKLILGFFGVNH